METTERLAFETDTINRALQHDVVLYGQLGSGNLMTFSWRRASGCISPRYHDRELAVEWMANWPAYDTPSGDK